MYRIPAKVISFNFDNARIAAEKNTIEGKLGRLLDPKKDEDQMSQKYVTFLINIGEISELKENEFVTDK